MSVQLPSVMEMEADTNTSAEILANFDGACCAPVFTQIDVSVITVQPLVMITEMAWGGCCGDGCC
jgi:hypothetical protein